jgi:hypothetical protein
MSMTLPLRLALWILLYGTNRLSDATEKMFDRVATVE